MSIIYVDWYLKEKYDKYNRLYFGGKLSASAKVMWSNRLKVTAGINYTDDNLIKISIDYMKKYPEDLDGVLLHEMVHQIIPNHSKEFKKYVKELEEKSGIKIPLEGREMKGQERKHKYTCPKCKIYFDRAREIDLSRARCGKCNSRFKKIK